MSEDLELKLLKEIEELKREIKELKGEEIFSVPNYSFSKIRDRELNFLFNIERKLKKDKFNSWFHNEIILDIETEKFLIKILSEEADYIEFYDKEDLKMRFLSQILRKIDFKSETFRDFYDEKITYKSENFILNGEVDFVISKGLENSIAPYFFIQEFKQSEEFGNPRPQLLAELIAGVELNSWQSIKGAYIIGSIWNFVILEKVETNSYKYYVSENFDSSKIDDLKAIYKNLLFVKDEIIRSF